MAGVTYKCCPCCAQTFVAAPGQSHCSAGCVQTDLARKAHLPRLATCQECQAEFQLGFGQAKAFTPRCQECKAKRRTVVCGSCGKQFMLNRVPMPGRGKYCSPECYHANPVLNEARAEACRSRKRIPRNRCRHCGRLVNPEDPRALFCSKKCYGLSMRGKPKGKRSPDPPSSEEIASMCEAIRATWSTEERLARRVRPEVPVEA